MGIETAVHWANATWNPWVGCLKVSPGCKACYMYRDQKRYGNDPKDVHKTKDATFNSPLTWARLGKLAAGARVFTCSWSDWFIDAADQWRDQAWDIVKNTPYIYMILTKRTENIIDRLPSDWGRGYPNVWLGVSVESNDYMHRAWDLVTIPAAVRFISYEPALSHVNFGPILSTGAYSWLISGGESDYKNPRPADLDWFRSARDQANAWDVAYFHKQHGGNRKGDGDAWGGRLLDGRTWDQLPTDALFAEMKLNGG